MIEEHGGLAFLESILEMLPDRIFIISQKGVFLAAYGGVNTKVEYDPQELLGRSIHELFANNRSQSDKFMMAIQNAIDLQETQVLTYRFDSTTFPNMSSLVLPSGVQWLEARIQALPYKIQDTQAVIWIVRNVSESEQLRRQLLHLSETDPLSTLLNRRAFVKSVEKQFKVLGPTHSCGALMIIDIDHFKQINDTHGHLAGDKYIYEISQLLRELFSGSAEGIVGRLGGEEFGVFLPGVNAQEAYALAEKCRLLIEKSSISFEQKKISATVSIGLRVVCDAASQYEKVMQQADQALYESKSAGRNRITCCPASACKQD